MYSELLYTHSYSIPLRSNSNFDNSVQRVKHWSSDRSLAGTASPATSAISPSSSTAHLVGLGLSMSSVSAPGLISDGGPSATGIPNLTASQRRRIKTYLKRCRLNPHHSQLNLEGYLLLPVQRIPRYRLLVCTTAFPSLTPTHVSFS